MDTGDVVVEVSVPAHGPIRTVSSKNAEPTEVQGIRLIGPKDAIEKLLVAASRLDH